MKTIYPAIFKKKNDESGIYYYVNFPSFPGAATNGDTLEEAFMNAKEVLALYVYNLENHTNYKDYDLFNLKLKDDEFALLVDANDRQEIIHAANRNSKQNKEYMDFLTNKAKEKQYSLSDVEFLLNLEKGFFKKLAKYKGIPDESLAKRIAKLLDINYKKLIKKY